MCCVLLFCYLVGWCFVAFAGFDWELAFGLSLGICFSDGWFWVCYFGLFCLIELWFCGFGVVFLDFWLLLVVLVLFVFLLLILGWLFRLGSVLVLQWCCLVYFCLGCYFGLSGWSCEFLV